MRDTRKHRRRGSDNVTGQWRCGSCDSSFVHPVAADERPGGSWDVELRCGECERRTRRLCSTAEADELDRQLDRATEEIAAELSHVEALHMQEWAERFVDALRFDLIGPDDFRPWRQ